MRIAPVLKSNAYGHGLTLIASLVDQLNAPFVCVDSLYEAYELLKVGLRTKILIMGFVHPASLKTKKLPFSFAVFTEDQIAAIARFQPQAPIHLFVDTGMHREGIPLAELKALVTYTKTKTPLAIEGVMSHFAMADKPRDPLTRKQLMAFRDAENLLRKLRASPRWSHIAASSALLNHKRLGIGLGNLARIGLAMYGIDPRGKDSNLRPVLELTTTIAQMKIVEKGERLGYDFTFTATRKMQVAVLPIGYNDGVDRRLSNAGIIRIGQTPCPIVGNVSMNITLADVTAASNPKVGQTAIVYSQNPKHRNSIARAAAICSTIPYDLLVHLHPSIRRTFK